MILLVSLVFRFYLLMYCTYITARVVTSALALKSLTELPPRAFDTLHWTTFMPHIAYIYISVNYLRSPSTDTRVDPTRCFQQCFRQRSRPTEVLHNTPEPYSLIIFISPYPITMSQLVGSVFTIGIDQPPNLSGSSQTGFPIERHQSKKSAFVRERDKLKQNPVTTCLWYNQLQNCFCLTG